MAEQDETTAAEQVQEVEQPQGGETDWKAEARKWEKYAKENADARKELDALKAAQMTEQERLLKRAEDAERALAEANAAIQHSKDVAEVSAASGVPAGLLEFCADRTAMERFAEQYGESKAPVASTVPASRIVAGDGGKASNRDSFAAMLADII